MRADFYLLTDHAPHIIWRLACHLLEKAYNRGHTVFVFCENTQDMTTIDELLWTYKVISFIPHNIQGEDPTSTPAIQIGCGPEPNGFNDILLNLSTVIPPFFLNFQRIMEIVLNVEAAKACSRQHYREYQANNIAMFTHHLGMISQ